MGLFLLPGQLSDGSSQTTPSLVATEDGCGNLNKWYFRTACPAEYMGDTAKVARFATLFGAQAAAMLQTYGAVEGHCDAVFQPTSEQKSVFNDEGKRAWYSVMDLMDVLPQNRAALGIDLSGYTESNLLDLYRTNPNFKFYTTGSTTVSSS
jgi:hypothetical protein